ncbi:MAG: hypothetical protein KGQ60_18035 [Planctomycetes bacterium]|nr:hypothetical protein [Planctomycetota bacterium]
MSFRRETSSGRRISTFAYLPCAAVMCITLVLSGCGGGSEATPPEKFAPRPPADVADSGKDAPRQQAEKD